MNGKNLKYFVMGAAIVAIGLGALAVDIPNSFSSGQVISSSALNANFAALKAAVDALEANGSVTAAKVADGAINAAKTADEPGFNTISDLSGTFSNISTTAASKASITLAAPAAGFAVVTANFNWLANHTTGTNTGADFSLSKTAGAIGGLASFQRVIIPGSQPTSNVNFQQSVALSEVFAVTAGNNTFHLNAQIAAGAGQSVGQVKMTAIYLPTRYGTGAAVN